MRGASPPLVPAHLRPAAYEAVRDCLRGAFDAVFAASDVIAISVVRARVSEGRSIPQDGVVVGCDDIAIAAHTTSRLTMIREDLARSAPPCAPIWCA